MLAQAGKVVTPGNFIVSFAAGYTFHRDSQLFKKAGIICHFQVLEFLVRHQDGFKVKPLRCLRPHQRITRNGAQNDLVIVALFDGVMHRNAGNGALVILQGIKNAVNDIGIDPGAGRVMDQDVIWCYVIQGA